MPTKRANVQRLFPVLKTAQPLKPRYLLNTRSVQRHFDRAATSFEAADFVHEVTRDGLFARLEPMRLDARQVLDLGCATGAALPRLEKRFRRARIVGVDISANMLQKAQAHRGWFSRLSFVHSDARALPVADHSVDLVFANLLLPWIDDPAAIAREVCRVLRKDGLFVFSGLGPDSLRELRAAWATVDNYAHVNEFPDMHNIGDALVQSGLRDPVLDVDRLQVSYSDSAALYRDLKAVGGRNALTAQRKSLTGKQAFARMQDELWRFAERNSLQLDLELVYGHCWGRGPASAATDVRIDAGAIPVRRR